jgi:hypothetical protein
MSHCWLRLTLHTPGRRWDGWTYAWTQCSKCERRYTTAIIRLDAVL